MPDTERTQPIEPAHDPAHPPALPSERDPDPGPEAERPTVAEVETNEGEDRGGTGDPVGTDNIREGRVRGLMGGSHPQGGQGQGG